MASFETGTVSNIIDQAQYDDAVAKRSHLIVFFWAEWHEPSKLGGQMDTVFSGLAARYPNISFLKIEAENVPTASVAEALGVSVVPTFVCVLSGNVWGKIEGANPPELNSLLKRFSGAEGISKEEQMTNAKLVLNDHLRNLVNSAPVMLFMKGSPDAPKCGFSRKIVELLRNNKIAFASFDILTDDSVRNGLKELYNWPTYPQLYVRGSLIGGLDILNEMASDTSSSLKDQLELTDSDIVPEPPSIDERLKALINKAPIMLFMKGSAAEAKCGFSQAIVQILQSEDLEFSTFDILEDEEVRQELKRYSNWPTYPQLYVNGTLVGGLDIVKEMKAEGPLREQLFP